MGDYRNAVEPLERPVTVNPDQLQAWSLLGVALLEAEEFAHATPLLERAAALDPDDPGSLDLLDRAYMEALQDKKALATFDRMETLSPSAPRVQILRAQTLDGSGAHQETLEEFEQARFHLADSCVLDEKTERALPAMKNHPKEKPRDACALLTRGKALEKLNRYQAGEDAARHATCDDREEAEAHFQLGRVLRKLNRMPESNQGLEIAQCLQKQRHAEQKSPQMASDARGDPTQVMRIVPGIAPGHAKKP